MASGPHPRRPSSRRGPGSPTSASPIAPSGRSFACRTLVSPSGLSHKSRRPLTAVSPWESPDCVVTTSATFKGVEIAVAAFAGENPADCDSHLRVETGFLRWRRGGLERHDAIFRPLVLPHPGERGGAHAVFLGELEEMHLGYEDWPSPECHVGVDLRHLRERAFFLA